MTSNQKVHPKAGTSGSRLPRDDENAEDTVLTDLSDHQFLLTTDMPEDITAEAMSKYLDRRATQNVSGLLPLIVAGLSVIRMSLLPVKRSSL